MFPPSKKFRDPPFLAEMVKYQNSSKFSWRTSEEILASSPTLEEQISNIKPQMDLYGPFENTFVFAVQALAEFNPQFLKNLFNS